MKRNHDLGSACDPKNAKTTDENNQVEPLNPMTFYPRFPLVGEQIFWHLDEKTLAKCREVSTLWLNCIDEKSIFWLKIFRKSDCNEIFQKACKNGCSKAIEILMKKPTEFKIEWNKEIFGKTSFHLACKNGHSNVAEILVQNSAEFNINLNAKDKYGKTGFHFACKKSHLETVEILIKNSIWDHSNIS